MNNLYELIQKSFSDKFDTENAGGRSFSLMFVNEDNDQCAVVIVKEGKLEFSQDKNLDADLIIITTLDIMNKILNGDVTGVDSYMEGDLELEGDRSMLEMLFEVFGIV